ncbi:MAG: hypothetical protein ACOCQD_05315 [archaeon]
MIEHRTKDDFIEYFDYVCNFLNLTDDGKSFLWKRIKNDVDKHFSNISDNDNPKKQRKIQIKRMKDDQVNGLLGDKAFKSLINASSDSCKWLRHYPELMNHDKTTYRNIYIWIFFHKATVGCIEQLRGIHPKDWDSLNFKDNKKKERDFNYEHLRDVASIRDDIVNASSAEEVDKIMDSSEVVITSGKEYIALTSKDEVEIDGKIVQGAGMNSHVSVIEKMRYLESIGVRFLYDDYIRDNE